jgi:hypothetical protein
VLKCLENEPNLKNQSNVRELRHVSHKSLEIKYAHKTIINTIEFGHGEASLGQREDLDVVPHLHWKKE